MDIYRFALQFIKDCCPDNTTVEFRRWPDDPDSLPLVIVDLPGLSEIGNGPMAVGFDGDIHLSIYALTFSQAYDLAQSIRSSALRLWYLGYKNNHGGISHIKRSMGYPMHVVSDIEDHSAERFDFSIPVIASTHTLGEQ